MKSKSKTFSTLWLYFQSIIGIIIFLILWHLLAVDTGLVSTPWETLQRFFTIWSEPVAKVSMVEHVLVSLGRVLLALLLACVIGIPLGVALGWNPKFRAVVKPIFETIRPVPPIAWIPLFTLWMGTGEVPRVLLVFIGVLMPIVTNATVGVEMVPALNIDVARIFGADKRKILFDIVLPSSTPAIMAGIRVALGSGFAVLLAAEMLSARSGIGFLITQGSDYNDLELSIVGMVMLGIFGALFTVAFDYIERKLCPWLKR